MEDEKSSTIYEDFKFITREEVEELGITKMIGTNQLKAYMHGFFIDYKLYNKVGLLIQEYLPYFPTWKWLTDIKKKTKRNKQ